MKINLHFSNKKEVAMQESMNLRTSKNIQIYLNSKGTASCFLILYLEHEF